jgi:hypothetical protein
MEESLRIEVSDIESKMKEHEKGVKLIVDECRILAETLDSLSPMA